MFHTYTALAESSTRHQESREDYPSASLVSPRERRGPDTAATPQSPEQTRRRSSPAAGWRHHVGPKLWAAAKSQEEGADSSRLFCGS